MITSIIKNKNKSILSKTESQISKHVIPKYLTKLLQSIERELFQTQHRAKTNKLTCFCFLSFVFTPYHEWTKNSQG